MIYEKLNCSALYFRGIGGDFRLLRLLSPYLT